MRVYLFLTIINHIAHTYYPSGPGAQSPYSLASVLRSIHSFVRFSRFDSPEDRADLVQMRSAQQDILVDMWLGEGLSSALSKVISMYSYMGRCGNR